MYNRSRTEIEKRVPADLAALQHLVHLRHIVVEHPGEDDVDVVEDRRQRAFQLVGDHGDEPVLVLLRPPRIGDVAEDNDCPAGLGLPQERGDAHLEALFGNGQLHQPALGARGCGVDHRLDGRGHVKVGYQFGERHAFPEARGEKCSARGFTRTGSRRMLNTTTPSCIEQII